LMQRLWQSLIATWLLHPSSTCLPLRQATFIQHSAHIHTARCKTSQSNDTLAIVRTLHCTALPHRGCFQTIQADSLYCNVSQCSLTCCIQGSGCRQCHHPHWLRSKLSI
jgi:hypothetical protein